MSKLDIPATYLAYVNALRSLIRTGAAAAPQLEDSPLIDLQVVMRRSGFDASPAKRAHTFITVLQDVIDKRLDGTEAKTASILFSFGPYAGMPTRERYKAVARIYSPYGTWENYRKEPLTRHLLSVYLALKREGSLGLNDLASDQKAPEYATTHNSQKVLIMQNISREAPGLIKRILDEAAVGYDIVDLSKTGSITPKPLDYAALVVLGGPDSANDDSPKIVGQIERLKQAFDAGVPYLGICLGLQLAAKAMGGRVVKSPIKEIGLRNPEGMPYSVSLTDVALTALGKKDPLFLGLKNQFRVFQLHSETIEPTTTMRILAKGQDCPNQIIKFRRNAYGIQSHFELTRTMLMEWLREDPDLKPLNEQKILAEFDAIEEVYTITGLSVFRNFFQLAKVIN